MCNHFTTITQLFIGITKNHKKHTHHYSILYFSPLKGTLTDAGDGDGGGANPKQSQKNSKTVRAKTVHTSGHFSKI